MRTRRLTPPLAKPDATLTSHEIRRYPELFNDQMKWETTIDRRQFIPPKPLPGDFASTGPPLLESRKQT